MQEWCWNIVLQLDDGDSQCRDGQELGAVDRPVPLKLPCWSHAELVGEMPPFVVVLMKNRLSGCVRNQVNCTQHRLITEATSAPI